MAREERRAARVWLPGSCDAIDNWTRSIMQLHDAEGHEGRAVPEASSGVGRSDAPTIHSFKWRRAGFLVAVATFVTTMAAVGVSGSWRATDRPGVAAPNPMTTILNTTPRVEVRRNGPSEVVDSAVASLGVTPGDRSVTATTRPLPRPAQSPPRFASTKESRFVFLPSVRTTRDWP